MKSQGVIRRLPLCLALAIATVTVFKSSAFGAEENKIKESAMAQIKALQQEKASRSPVQRKLDSQFVFKLKQNRGQAIAAGVTALKADIEVEQDGRVLVDIDAKVTPALLNQITSGGGTVVNSFPQFRAVRAYVPVSQLETLAGSPDVKFIKRAAKPLNNAGPNNSEGDVTHRATLARNNFAVDGRGVKVGVLSDGVAYLGNSQSLGELDDVTVLPGQEGPFTGAEGTAMLEIIHDLAPGAQLYFATAFNGEANFAQNILNLRSNGCDIIVDDVYYYDEPPFQDGIIAQAVNAVTADGALYFSSAGNDGNTRYGSGTWEGDFVDSGQTLAEYGGKIHSFGGTNYNTILSGGYGVDLFWADPAGGSTNDYDLYLVDASGAVVYVSNNSQTGSQDPYERINIVPPADYRVVVVKSTGASRFLHLVTSRGRLSFTSSGTTRGHSAATNSFSVAAVNVNHSFPGAFTSANTVEYFSSDGPRRVFFNSDGSPITPGNFSSTGGAVRQKPDIAAADGVKTSVPGFSAFYGTSASAPHAAAIAALLKSYNSSLSTAQIRNALTSSALDIETPGIDALSGVGIVMADLALQALPPRPVIAAGYYVLANETCPGGGVDPGELVTVSISLTNIGVGNTTNLTATLLNTGGVTFASGSQSYGALQAKGGVADRFFTFVPTGTCGATNVLTLQLQDGLANLGTVSLMIQLGTLNVRLAENFDSVTPPALPAGWAATSSGTGLPWRTSNGWYDTPNNALFVPHPSATSDKAVMLPLFHVNAPGQLSFRQYPIIAAGYGGGVLEISTNGTPYQDIILAGGNFLTNGYNGNIFYGYNNALEGRNAWTGSNAPITTIVNLPLEAVGTDVRLRLRFASGSEVFGSNVGWFVDSIRYSEGYTCCNPPTNGLVVSALAAPNPVLLNGTLMYTVNIQNLDSTNAAGISITDILPSNFTMQSVIATNGIYPGPIVNGGGTLNFTVTNLAAGTTATFMILGTADAVGVMTNRVSISRVDGGLVTFSNATVATAVVAPALSVPDVTLVENDAGTTNAIFNVSLAPAPATNVTVRFATSNLTAVAGKDYFSTNGLLTFGPGVSNQSFAVRVIGNLINESNRTFTVNILTPTNAILSKGQGIGAILDNDPFPYVSVSDTVLIKPNSGTTNAIFNVSLSSPSGKPVSVGYSTRDGSAIGNVPNDFSGAYVDYSPTNNNLTFAPGQTNLQVRVIVTNHVSVKPTQYFGLNISIPVNTKLLRETGVGTIVTALPGRVDHFTWGAISSPKSNGLPFTASISARDFFEGAATNFSGAVAISGLSAGPVQTNTILGNSYGFSLYANGSFTFGYSFTPRTNLNVTHFRHRYGSKVSLWTETGTLIAQKNVTNDGAWAETALAAPVTLLAGRTYRIGFYGSGGFATTATATLNYPDVTLNQEYYAAGDAFPTLIDTFHFALVDIRYTVDNPTPLFVTPTNSGNFTNNSWTGAITVQLPGTNVMLFANDGAGHSGTSQKFDVLPMPGQLTHFAWDPVASPQPVSNSFNVKITALDHFNNVASNFVGTASLSAAKGVAAARTNTFLGTTNGPLFYFASDQTLGHSFKPSTNMVVTHVRHYFGDKVSIWSEAGALLTSQNVSSFEGEWTETALSSPIQLFAGQTYRIGAHTINLGYYHDNLASNYTDGTILQAYFATTNGFPDTEYNFARWFLVDIRYTVGFQVPVPVPVSPTNSGGFTNGVWLGSMQFNQIATNLTLLADDKSGHMGQSNPFDVGFVHGYIERFVWSTIPSPQTNGVPFPVTITALDHFGDVITNYNGAVNLSSLGSTIPPGIAPSVASNFFKGVWSNSISVFPARPTALLRANDGTNHLGSSNPFTLLDPPLLPPQMQGLVVGTGNIQFNWNAIPGHQYQVQYKTNLTQTNWLNLSSPFTATNTTLGWFDSFSDPERYYRIQLGP